MRGELRPIRESRDHVKSKVFPPVCGRPAVGRSLRSGGLAALVGAAVLWSGAAAEATPVTGARFAVFLGNDLAPNSTYLSQDYSVTDPTGVDESYSRDFTGNTSSSGGGEGEGEASAATATMTLSAAGKAQSSGGSLKASVTATVTNPLFVENNSPYVIDTNFNTDPNGIPGTFSASSLATYTDSLTVSGAGALSSIQVTFGLTGSIAEDPNDPSNFYVATSALVIQNPHGPYALGGESYLYGAITAGSIDATVLANPIDVVGGVAELSFGLLTEVDYTLDSFFLNEFASYTSTADFFNTLQITDVTGFGANGEEVFLTDVVASDGTVILQRQAPMVHVPEPASFAVFGLGLLGVGGLARRRGSAA